MHALRVFSRPRSLLWLLGLVLLYPAPAAAQSTTNPNDMKAAIRAFSGVDGVGKDGPLAKVGLDLALAYEEFQSYQRGPIDEAFAPSNAQLPIKDDRVTVDVSVGVDLVTAAAALRSIGMEVSGAAAHMVSGELPIEAIDDLAALRFVRFAIPAYRTTLVGATNNQGDVAMNSDDVRTRLAVNGAGVSVGVLSDSYNFLGGAAADVASGDLPGVGNPNGFITPVNVLADAGNTDEGRGMLQLIHDVAPGAALAFATAGPGQAGFATNITNLRTVAGCNIIVDDVIYYAEPMFQDGVVAQASDACFAAGVPYFSSAGNQARNAYDSPYRASNFHLPLAFPSAGGATLFFGGTAHDFDPGAGVDEFQQIVVPPGNNVILSFQWDSPFFSVSGGGGSPNDVDIYLFNAAANTVVGGSTAGNIGGDAVEVVSYNNTTGANQTLNIMIVNFAGPAPGRLKYVMFSGGINQFATNSGTIYGHANAVGAEAVGAAYYQNTPAFGQSPPLAEGFSSAGTTPILFTTGGAPTLDARADKPEITAPDGVNTTFFGGDSDGDGFPNFFGTSAAAPNAAAVAALIREEVPGVTPAQTYSALETTAIDMDVFGYDNNTGFGLVHALNAICTFDDDDPVITCPQNITVECTSHDGTPKNHASLAPFFGGVSATDECDDTPTITNGAPAYFPLGTTTVTFTATDDHGNSSQCQADVTVVDTTPPTLTVSLSPDELWPPNHKMAPIHATVVASDVCDDDLTVVLLPITSDEPDNGLGDGDTEDDIQEEVPGTLDADFLLRSERQGGGDGRLYIVCYRATDHSGNTTVTCDTVVVPHDQSAQALVALVENEPELVIFGSYAPVRGITPGTLEVGNELSRVQPVGEPSYEDRNADGIEDAVYSFGAEDGDRVKNGHQSPSGLWAHWKVGDSGFLAKLDATAVAGTSGGPIPTELAVSVRPNPAPGWAGIRLALPREARVRLSIFDLAGREVERLVDGDLPAGYFTARWNPRGKAGAQMYLYRLEAMGRTLKGRFIMLH